MCGKLAISDLPRVKDVCSAERIHLPYFMEPMAAYRTRLLQIARLNGVTVMEVNAAPSSLCFGKTSKTSHTDSASRSFQDSKNTRPAVRSSAFYATLLTFLTFQISMQKAHINRHSKFFQVLGAVLMVKEFFSPLLIDTNEISHVAVIYH